MCRSFDNRQPRRLVAPVATGTVKASKQKAVLSAQSNNCKVRRVRFEETEDKQIKVDVIGSLIRPASDMMDWEKEELWWQDKDNEFFKKTATVIATQIQRQLATTRNPDSSYAAVNVAAYIATLQPEEGYEGLTKEQKRQLEYWTKIGHCRRGLERWIIPVMAHDRIMRKNMAVDGVLDAQRIIGNRLDYDQKSKFIRETYEENTRSARLYAQLMGEADAVAAREYHEKTTVHKLNVDSPAPISLPQSPAKGHLRTILTSCFFPEGEREMQCH